jgi:hypothetical protein
MKFERRIHAAGLFDVRERRRWKSTPQPPAPPNPVTVANAQTGTNIGTAVANTTMGNVNQVGPTGSSTFDQTGGYFDPATKQFVPSFTETNTLNPTLQGILSGTENLGAQSLPIAGNLLSQYGTTATTPLNPNSINNTTIAGGPQALDSPVSTAAYNAATNFLTPTFQQQQKDLQDQLSRQGLPLGGSAYSNAENQLENTQNSALVGAANNAVVTGANQANNMYGLALQGQNQQLGQQALIQQQPANLLAALYGGGTTGGTPRSA